MQTCRKPFWPPEALFLFGFVNRISDSHQLWNRNCSLISPEALGNPHDLLHYAVCFPVSASEVSLFPKLKKERSSAAACLSLKCDYILIPSWASRTPVCLVMPHKIGSYAFSYNRALLCLEYNARFLMYSNKSGKGANRPVKRRLHPSLLIDHWRLHLWATADHTYSVGKTRGPLNHRLL